MNFISKVAVLLLILSLSLSGCIIKDTPEPDGPKMASLSISIDKITALKSCEGDGTSGEADIYTNITIVKRESVVSQAEILKESETVLVQLGRFESSSSPGISETVDIELKDGLIIAANIVTYELDPGGSKDATKTFSFAFIYEEDLGCWLEDKEECAKGTSPGSSQLTRAGEFKMSEGTCDVEYEYSVSITPQ